MGLSVERRILQCAVHCRVLSNPENAVSRWTWDKDKEVKPKMAPKMDQVAQDSQDDFRTWTLSR